MSDMGRRGIHVVCWAEIEVGGGEQRGSGG